jgi:UDP-glucose 4-epimerase
LQIINEVSNQLNVEINVKTKKRRMGDPVALITDAKKIRKELGWEHYDSTLSNIVETSIKWMNKKYEGLISENETTMNV